MVSRQQVRIRTRIPSGAMNGIGVVKPIIPQRKQHQQQLQELHQFQHQQQQQLHQFQQHQQQHHTQFKGKQLPRKENPKPRSLSSPRVGYSGHSVESTDSSNASPLLVVPSSWVRPTDENNSGAQNTNDDKIDSAKRVIQGLLEICLFYC